VECSWVKAVGGKVIIMGGVGVGPRSGVVNVRSGWKKRLEGRAGGGRGKVGRN